jgi:LuxR family maltose regulon positive regulatory protein
MENFTVAHVTAARLKSAAGKHGEALRLLDCLHSVLESIGYRRLLALVCFEKVRIWLLQDRPARAVQVLADFGQARSVDTGASEDELEEFALSRVALLMHRSAHEQAADMLRPLCRRAQADGYVYGHIRVQAALATCYWHAEDEETAFELLDDAYALTEHRGFSRAVFDDVPGLPLLFSSAIKRGRLAALPSAEYFRKFQEVLACDPYTQPQVDTAIESAQNPLTQRELDLLKLLSQGLTNRNISERCNITLFTTKWHLKNVFAKLGVSTRMEAVFRAQQLQLVDAQRPVAHVR